MITAWMILFQLSTWAAEKEGPPSSTTMSPPWLLLALAIIAQIPITIGAFFSGLAAMRQSRKNGEKTDLISQKTDAAIEHVNKRADEVIGKTDSIDQKTAAIDQKTASIDQKAIAIDQKADAIASRAEEIRHLADGNNTALRNDNEKMRGEFLAKLEGMQSLITHLVAENEEHKRTALEAKKDLELVRAGQIREDLQLQVMEHMQEKADTKAQQDAAAAKRESDSIIL